MRQNKKPIREMTMDEISKMKEKRYERRLGWLRKNKHLSETQEYQAALKCFNRDAQYGFIFGNCVKLK